MDNPNWVLIKSRNLTLLWVGWAFLFCANLVSASANLATKRQLADSQATSKYWFDKYMDSQECNTCEP